MREDPMLPYESDNARHSFEYSTCFRLHTRHWGGLIHDLEYALHGELGSPAVLDLDAPQLYFQNVNGHGSPPINYRHITELLLTMIGMPFEPFRVILTGDLTEDDCKELEGKVLEILNKQRPILDCPLQ